MLTQIPDDGHEAQATTHEGRIGYPVRLAGIYALVAIAWVLLSGAWIAALFRDPATLHLANSANGLVFVAITTGLLYVMARRHSSRFEQSIRVARRATLLGEQRQRLIVELLDSSPDAIFAKDRRGRYTLVNRAVSRLTGRDAADILGQDDTAIFPPEQAELIVRNDRSVMNDDAVLRTVERLSMADGEIVYLVTKGPLHDANGRVSGMFGISRDITEREAAKEKAANALEALRESQEIARVASYLLDIERDVWESSDGLERLLGMDAGHAHTFAGSAALLAPEDRGAIEQYFVHDVLGNGQMFDREFRIIRPLDGVQRWVHGRGRLEFDAAGKPIRMRGTIQDITERVEAQAKARLWLEVFERSGLCFAISDVHTNRLIDVNPAFAARRGYTVDEMRGMMLDQLFAPGFTPAYRDDKIEVESKAQVFFESRHICKDGSTFPVWVDLTVISDAKRHVNMRVACAFDITSRRKAEDDLRIAATAFEAQHGIMVTNAAGVL